MGWTRDQVVDYMRKNDVNEPLIQSETDRYIAWPAQACSYKLGQLKIIELRERAKKELGPKFDIRTFHDEILSGGGLPLDMLDARTTQWIATPKVKTHPDSKCRRTSTELRIVLLVPGRPRPGSLGVPKRRGFSPWDIPSLCWRR